MTITDTDIGILLLYIAVGLLPTLELSVTLKPKGIPANNVYAYLLLILIWPINVVYYLFRK
jgi:hypothetical protein